jgi:hypothetical protein
LSSTGGTIIESFTLHLLTLTEGRCGCRNCDQHESEDRRIVGRSKRSHGQNFSFTGLPCGYRLCTCRWCSGLSRP